MSKRIAFMVLVVVLFSVAAIAENDRGQRQDTKPQATADECGQWGCAVPLIMKEPPIPVVWDCADGTPPAGLNVIPGPNCWRFVPAAKTGSSNPVPKPMPMQGKRPWGSPTK